MPTGLWLYAWIGLWVLVLLEGVLLSLLLRHVGGLYEYWVKGDPEQGPKVGNLAPALPEVDLYGRPAANAGAGKMKAILFMSKGCGSCRDSMRFVPALSRRTDLSTVLVVSNPEADAKSYVEGQIPTETLANVTIVADPGKAVFDSHRVTTTPYAIVIDPEGRIAVKGIVNRLDEMDRLLKRAEMWKRRAVLEVVSDHESY
jgi:hypothetical protein